MDESINVHESVKIGRSKFVRAGEKKYKINKFCFVSFFLHTVIKKLIKFEQPDHQQTFMKQNLFFYRNETK